MSTSNSKNFRAVLSRILVVFLCITAIISGPLLTATKKSSYANRPPALLPFAGEEDEDEEEEREFAEAEEGDRNLIEDPEGRSDWFFAQRAYPSGELPSDARQSAWESVSRPGIQTQALTNATTTWEPIGPAPTQPGFSNWGLTSGRINAVAVSPSSSQIVLVGSSTGGIWRSNNAGASFSPVTDAQVDLAVGSIVFAPSNPSIVYAGMGDTKLGYLGSGVLKSTNSGSTWAKVNNNSLPSPGTVAKIEVDPANADRVYVAQYTRLSEEKIISSGFFRSTDGGVSWTRTLAGAARDIAISPSNRQTLFVGTIPRPDMTEPVATPGLHRSTDGGTTWTNVYSLIYDTTFRRDVKVAVTPARPQAVYLYTGGFVSNILFVRLSVSTDNGTTWTDLNTAFDTAQIGYNTYVVVDPRNADTIYIGSRDIYRSNDGGFTWENLTRSFSLGPQDIYLYTPGIASTHPDQHALAISPSNANDIYIGNDGGLSKSTDRGTSFRSLNSTLSLTQFVGIALHPTNPQISYGGTQDNGTQLRLPNSNQWFEFAPGDGGRCVINPQNPSIVVTNYFRGNLYRFSDNGRSYETQVAFTDTFGESNDFPRIGFYPPFVGNGVDQTLYIGTYRLFLSTTLGDSWFPPGGEFDQTKGVNEKGADFLSAIGVSRSNTNIIYTGSAQGRAMISTDAGATWSDITRGLPDRFITSIVVDSARPATAYLSVSGFRSSHVFKTTDAGANWTDASAGLPDIPVSALLIDPLDSEKIYAGTDIGVFRKNGGGNWQSFNSGIPPVVITGFAAQASGLIQVSTYGRGAFEITSENDSPFVSSAAFDGKKKLSISGLRFGAAPQVLINDVDKSSRITAASNTSIKLKSKAAKLGLKTGDNTIQVIGESGNRSNIFVLKL